MTPEEVKLFLLAVFVLALVGVLRYFAENPKEERLKTKIQIAKLKQELDQTLKGHGETEGEKALRVKREHRKQKALDALEIKQKAWEAERDKYR